MRQNKKVRQERSQRGVSARLRNIAERPAPKYPADPPEVWATIEVARSINGHVQREKLFLNGISGNSFEVWDEKAKGQPQCLGVSGIRTSLSDIGKRFVRVRR